jgi:DNA helicase-2/ATP-dependent DNA helicase PcrA
LGLSRQSEAAADEELVLSTIHQAKGLEWRAVFVIGLADGLFPHAKTFEHPEEMEEERRLFYVASTRAKEELYLTYPLFSADNILRPSQFIKELPIGDYERWDLEAENGRIDDNEIKYIDEDEEYNVKPTKRKMMDFDPRLD